MYCAAMGSFKYDVSDETFGVATVFSTAGSSETSPDSNCRIRSSKFIFTSSSLFPSLVKALACCAAISNLLATVASPKLAISSLYILFLLIFAKARGLTPSEATSSSSTGASKVLRSPSAASPASSPPFAKESSSAGDLKFKESISFCSSFVKPVSGSTLFLRFSWRFIFATLASMAPVSVPSDKGTVVATFLHLRGFKLIGSTFAAGSSYELSREPSRAPPPLEESSSDSPMAASLTFSPSLLFISSSCSSLSLEENTESSNSTDAKASAASLAPSSSMEPLSSSNMSCSSGETPIAIAFLFALFAFFMDFASFLSIAALISSKASMRFINSISSGVLPANRMASAFAFALAALLSRASCSFLALAASNSSFSSSSCCCTAFLCASTFAALANSFFAASKSISSSSSEEFAASFRSFSGNFSSSACATISSICLKASSSSVKNGSGWSSWMFSLCCSDFSSTPCSLSSSASAPSSSLPAAGETSNSTTSLCTSPVSVVTFRDLLL